MSGGGGAQGTIDFPGYMKDVHKEWLGNADNHQSVKNTYEIINEGITGNPFKNHYPFMPDADIDAAHGDAVSVSDGIQSLDIHTDWTAHLIEAIADRAEFEESDIDQLMLNAKNKTIADLPDLIQAAVDSIDDEVLQRYIDQVERRLSYKRNQSIGRFTSSVAGVNGSHSSSFLLGIAMIESQHQQNIADADSEIRNNMYQTNQQQALDLYKTQLTALINVDVKFKMWRNEFVNQTTTKLMQAKMSYEQLKQGAVQLKIEAGRMKFLLKNQGEETKLTRAESEFKYNLELYQMGGNILAAPSGVSSMVQKGNSQLGSALGGALTGGMAGAEMSAGNPYVTAGAAVAGGIAGLLG